MTRPSAPGTKPAQQPDTGTTRLVGLRRRDPREWTPPATWAPARLLLCSARPGARRPQSAARSGSASRRSSRPVSRASTRRGDSQFARHGRRARAEFIAATGGDMEAFGTSDRLASFAGLAPVPRDSGRDSARTGRLHPSWGKKAPTTSSSLTWASGIQCSSRYRFVEGGTATRPHREPVGSEHHDAGNGVRSLIAPARQMTR
jgi:hypothetical protein